MCSKCMEWPTALAVVLCKKLRRAQMLSYLVRHRDGSLRRTVRFVPVKSEET